MPIVTVVGMPSPGKRAPVFTAAAAGVELFVLKQMTASAKTVFPGKEYVSVGLLFGEFKLMLLVEIDYVPAVIRLGTNGYSNETLHRWNVLFRHDCHFRCKFSTPEAEWGTRFDLRLVHSNL